MYINVSAFILNASLRGEAQRRLSLFTRERGRMWARLAVAVKMSRLAFLAYPCSEVLLRLWLKDGRTTAAQVTGGTLVHGNAALRRHWSLMNEGLFFCEWTHALTPQDQPHPEKYDLLSRALRGLCSGGNDWARLAFMVQFLDKAGYTVGPAVVGACAPEQEDLLDRLRRFSFGRVSVFDGRDYPTLWERRILAFVRDHLGRTFRTYEHKNKLDAFQRKMALI